MSGMRKAGGCAPGPASAASCGFSIFRRILRTETRRKHLKADTVGRTSISSLDDFKTKVKSSMLSLQRNPEKVRSFFQKPSLKYAA